MAALTTTKSGNWNDTTVWSSGTLPVLGTDTCTIGNGHNVTIPAGYTAGCGTYPADDTGTPALQQPSAFGTGTLTVNGTLKYAGPVRMAEATWTVGAGGTITYDASGAANPDTALYTWQTGAQNGTVAKLVFNGTSGSRCTVNSVGNHQSGGFGNVTGYQGGGQVRASFTDFAYVGAATTSGNAFNGSLNAGADFHLDDCTLDHCAQIQMTGPFAGGVASGIASTATFRLLRTRITNPVNPTYTLQLYLSGGALISTGERRVEGCEIAGQIYLSSSDGAGHPAQGGFTFKHNVLRVRSTTVSSPPVNLNGTGVAAWDQNLVVSATSSTQDSSASLGAGTYANSYLLSLTSANGTIGANKHPLYLDQRIADTVVQGWVLHNTDVASAGDIVNLNRDGLGANNVKLLDNLYLEGAANLAPGSFLNQQGAVTQTNTKIYFEHNTAAARLSVSLPSTGAVYGVGAEGGANWPAGAIPSIRGNLLWGRTSGGGLVANSATPSATVASGAVTAADYNGTYNVTGSIYGNPAGQFASTPGTHDVSGDPAFVDRDRSVLNFDQGYLGAAAATAWASGTAYAVGDVRSVSVGTFYGGATYNWRCTTAHTSSASDKPASGDNFPTYWEPAALKSIADSVLAGTTYSGGTNSLVGELVAWVKAGFAPTNAIYHNAAHDGTDIGAVAYASVGPSVAPSAAPNPVTGTNTTLAANLTGGTAPYTYAWTLPGATLSNSAVANPTATFTAAGTYTASLTVTDANSATGSGSVTLTVSQTLAAITVTPGAVSLASGNSATFAASGTDQFGGAMSPQPSFTFSTTGGPTINSSTGVATGGNTTVKAVSGGVTGTAQISGGGATLIFNNLSGGLQ